MNLSRCRTIHSPRALLASALALSAALLLGFATELLCQEKTPAPAPPAPTAAPSPDEENKAFVAAQRAFESASYSVAESFFSEFLKTYPSSDKAPEAALFMARAILKQGDADRCLAVLREHLTKSGRVTDQYLYWMAESYYQKGDLKSASDQFALLLKQHPTSTWQLEASYSAARCHFKLGEWGRVVELLSNPKGNFREATKVRSNDNLVISGDLMLVEALLELKNYSAAEEVSRSLARRTLVPEMKWRQEQLLGRVLLESQQLQPALNQSSNAVTSAAATGLASASAEAYALQATILTRLNRLEEAAKVYEQNLGAASPIPRQKEALLQIIQLRLAQNEFGLATQKLDALLTSKLITTNTDIALLTYGEIFLRDYVLRHHQALSGTNAYPSAGTNLLSEALQRFDQVIQARPSGPILGLAQLNKGWALWAQNRFVECRQAFQDATENLTWSEQQATAQYKLAETQFRLNEYTNALTSFRKFTNQFLTLPRIRNTLLDQALIHMVRIGFELNDTRSASEAMERLLSWKPDSAYVDRSLLLMGQHLTLRDQPQKAREWLSKVPDLSTQKPVAELLIAESYTREGRWTNALGSYTGWLSRFATNQELRPNAEYYLALATYGAGGESNAFILFTNFVATYPDHLLAPQAQFWIGEYFLRQQNYTNSEIHFRRLYQNTNWPVTKLTYDARMQEGRAAFARQGYNNAQELFTGIVNEKDPPYPKLVAEAFFALGDCLWMQATTSTNAVRQLELASTAFRNITLLYPTNEVAPKAWGNLGNCYLQLAQQDSADNYKKATNAYHQVLLHPLSSASNRSEAEIGIALVLKKLAESATQTRDRQALLDRAQLHLQRVLYEKNLQESERPDPFWQKKAGLEAALISESTLDWRAAAGIYERLKQIFPQVSPDLERRLARAKSLIPQDQP
ncbi:MAG: tetratricopeptide repeat protein [Verrucomicrobiales bacterium]|nr:tetratricopeptide repeat protein [Verrucomicrobiales bacterium]